MIAAAFCRDAAQHLHDKKTAAVQLTTLRAFRHFLHRCCPYELREIAIVAFFDWLERGGNLNDAHIAKLNPRKLVRHRLTLPIICRCMFSWMRSDIRPWL